jgi:hypothetical protein
VNKYKKCSFKRILLNVEYNLRNEKKAIYLEFTPGTHGYIIGDCIKYEGIYKEGMKNSLDYYDYEPGQLINRKAIKLYKVLLDFNNIVLVNKEDVKIIEEIKPGFMEK